MLDIIKTYANTSHSARRKDGALRLAYLVRGYLINIKNLSDILKKGKIEQLE